MPETLSTALTETARDMSAIRDPDLLFRAIAERTRTVLGTDMAYVSLNDAAGARTAIRATSGVRTEAYARIAMPLGTGVLGLAAGGSPVATADYLADTRRTHLTDIDAAVAGEGVRAIAGVPLLSGGRALGALMVADRTARIFTDAEMDLLRALGHQAAVAAELLGSRAHLVEARAELAALRDESAAWRIRSALRDGVAPESTPGQIAEAAERLLGASIVVLDASGTAMTVRHPPPDLPPVDDLVSALAEGDGSTAVAAGSAVALLWGAERPAGVVVVSPPPPDGVTTDLADLVAAARLRSDALATSRQRVQQELLADLLAFRAGDTAVLRRAATAHILPTTALIAVVVLSGSSVRATAAALRARVADAGLVSTVEGVTRVLLRTEPAADPVEWVRRTIGDAIPLGATTGCAGPVVGIEHIGEAFAEAGAVARALRAVGRIDEIADQPLLGVAGMLLGTGSPAATDAFIRRQLGGLADADDARSRELLETLQVYVAAGENLARTAERLGRHINTVRQRLDRLDAILERGWRTDRRLDVHVALVALALRAR